MAPPNSLSLLLSALLPLACVGDAIFDPAPTAIDFYQEAKCGEIMISMTATLETESWVSMAIAPDAGWMVGARAFIGFPGAGDTASEWALNGKIQSSIPKVSDSNMLSLASSFVIAQNDDGLYTHHLLVTLPQEKSGIFNGLDDICGLSIIWGHSVPGLPDVWFHGKNRGVLGNIKCPDPESASETSACTTPTRTVEDPDTTTSTVEEDIEEDLEEDPEDLLQDTTSRAVSSAKASMMLAVSFAIIISWATLLI